MPKKTNVVAIDLSSLPSALQEAVGTDLALSITRNLKLGKKPIVIGRLGGGLWGYISPDPRLGKQIEDAFKAGPR